MELIPACCISLAIAVGGRLFRALTGGGMVAAVLVGSAILARTGWAGCAALGAFFAGSSLISRLAPDHSVARFDAKGHQRDAAQVLANGGAAAVGAILLDPPAALWVVAASLAAAAADTWATAAGGWSRIDPRFILTGAPVPPGTSGGITPFGTLGAVGGAAVVAVSAGLIAGDGRLVALCTVIGCSGMLLDSVLGALVQARFHCPACAQPAERPRHRCGAATELTGGVAWINNDVVNGLATTAAALLGMAAWRLVS
jgi:uncharacterized protein (TIGR00297 family)